MQDAVTLDKRMLVWWDALKHYRIPLDCYKELFDMAFDERQLRMAEGKDIPIEAALLISCWTRPHGLKTKIEQRRIDEGRTLSGSAMSQCLRCFGTGLENRFDADGRVIGIVIGKQCEHLPVTEGDPLFRPPAKETVDETANVVAGKFD